MTTNREKELEESNEILADHIKRLEKDIFGYRKRINHLLYNRNRRFNTPDKIKKWCVKTLKLEDLWSENGDTERKEEEPK